jgi:prepilin-type N-terminal cleavage/methylation domain-containing protein
LQSQKKNNSQKGVTLIEVIVSLCLLGILLSGVLSLQKFMSSTSARDVGLCRNVLTNLLETVKVRGQASFIFNWQPAPGPVRYVRKSNGRYRYQAMSDSTVDESFRWPQDNRFAILTGGTATLNPFEVGSGDWVASPATSTSTTQAARAMQASGSEESLKNALLIDSFMNQLLALYNSDPATFCESSTGKEIIKDSKITGYPAWPLPPKENLPGNGSFSVTMKIEPRALTDPNSSLAPTKCPKNLLITPMGLYTQTAFDAPSTDSAVAYNEAAVGFARVVKPLDIIPNLSDNNNVRDVGLHVQLKAQYNSSADSTQKEICEINDFLKYDTDIGKPKNPVLRVVENSSYNPSSSVIESCTVSSPNSKVHAFKLQINSPIEQEPGIQLLCLDASYYIIGTAGWDYENTVLGTKFNYPNSAPFTVANVANLPIKLPPADGSKYSYKKIQAVPPKWVGCESVTVCGVPANVVSLCSESSCPSTSLQIDLAFSESDTNRLDRSCYVDLRAVAVDTAGNMSDIVQLVAPEEIPQAGFPFGGVLNLSSCSSDCSPMAFYPQGQADLANRRYHCPGGASTVTTTTTTTTTLPPPPPPADVGGDTGGYTDIGVICDCYEKGTCGARVAVCRDPIRGMCSAEQFCP